MKVVLAAVNSKFVHSNLAVRYLKAYTSDLNYECNIREFSINDRRERVLEEIINEKPDLVAFSCYIWNIEFVQSLANLIKLVNSNIEILFGGPEVSYDSMQFLQASAGDYVIEGEGEETYREFIEYKLNLKELPKIKGIYYREGSEILYGGKRQLMDINKVIFPYNADEDLSNKIVYYEASRGCPFKCKYCLSSTEHGVRFLEAARVKKDLQFFIDKKVRLVKFVDRTFNCNKKFSIELWQFLINLKTDTSFHFEISADILSKEEIKLLASVPKGRFQFEVGVQTTNDEVLKNINRYVNFQDIKEKVEELEKLKNIKQHLDLIAGLPGEDFESFKKSFNDVYSIKPEEIQLGFLKLLKGSSMREEAGKWGMIYSPYPPYEIIKTNLISYEELLVLKRVEEVLDKYYNSGKFNSIIKYFEDKFESPFDFYYKLGMFFYCEGYLSRSISSVDYYRAFIEFSKKVLNEDSNILSEIIKFDYLKYNKKRWMPDFLKRYDLDKEFEKKLKRSLDEKNPNEKNNYHIEKFKMNMMEFLYDGSITGGEYLLAFNENQSEDILDISNF